MERLALPRKKERLMPDEHGDVHLRGKFISRLRINPGHPTEVYFVDGRECEIPAGTNVIVDRETD